jgi:pimeloyl-ACP methyl ester carboxylesterase
MPYVSVNKIKLYYEVHGDGPVTVVLAHGRSGGHLVWWKQVPTLSKRYRVVTFDHRGFGLSQDTTGEFRAAFASDLAGLLDHLNIQSAYLVGQSMGGWTILSYAVANPHRVAGLVMADTSGGLADPAVLAEYRRKGPSPTDPAERGLGPTFRKRDADGAFLYRQIGAMNPPAPESLMSLLLSDNGPTAVDVKKLKCKTLFIVGEDDPTVTPKIAKMCARIFPKASIKVIPKAGHSVYFERPKLFNSLIIDFIDNGRK